MIFIGSVVSAGVLVCANCLNADRIWASTPQIADYTDFADYGFLG